jgi:methylated-DNA-[protein]-cysteine S-methyltransferase
LARLDGATSAAETTDEAIRSGATRRIDGAMIVYSHIDSPVGTLLLAADDEGLRLIEFPSPRHPMSHTGHWHAGDHPHLRQAREQLAQYFAGSRRHFELPLAPHGTPFQCQVWHALAGIAYGETISYAQLASLVGRPSAVRAVGAANGRNPLPIVLPCHRVIGSDGDLTGFGGGLPTKRYLLTLEGALPGEDDLFAMN